MTRDGISSAARTLGSSRSPRKAAASRANGTRGGRPSRYLLIDDLGRCVGDTVTRAGQAGVRVEYGFHRADVGCFEVVGIARLARPSDERHRTDIPDRRWDC